MGKVTTHGTVSLDGYVVGPNGSGSDLLFFWFDAGEFEFPSWDPEFKIRQTESDHRYMHEVNDRIGVLVVGRRMFDQTNGWGGRHPFDTPVVVVTHSVPDDWVAKHPEAAFMFVTDGIESAIERGREVAGERDVEVTPGSLLSQCLELGLIDEISFDLVPVLLGGGVSFFEPLRAAPIMLDGPGLVLEGARVTHLRYTVRKS